LDAGSFGEKELQEPTIEKLPWNTSKKRDSSLRSDFGEILLNLKLIAYNSELKTATENHLSDAR